jgi:putative hydrolase of the HAD superfamily
MAIDAVLFDAAETLFTTRGSVGEIYGRVAREFGCTAPFHEIQSAFARQFRHSGPLSTTAEKAWWRDVVFRVFSDVGMVRDFNRFFEKVYDQFRDSRAWILFPETHEVLGELKERSVKLGVISNFDSRVYEVMRELEILAYFNSVTISSEVGYAKPDPEIFAAAARSLNIPPERILLIGDSLHADVLAARRAGMKSILIDRENRHPDTDVERIGSLKEVLSLPL